MLKGWEGSEEGESGLFTELTTRPCLMSEFNGVNGIDDDTLKFYPPSKIANSDISIYGEKMLCLENTDELKMWGNYNTPRT